MEQLTDHVDLSNIDIRPGGQDAHAQDAHAQSAHAQGAHLEVRVPINRHKKLLDLAPVVSKGFGHIEVVHCAWIEIIPVKLRQRCIVNRSSTGVWTHISLPPVETLPYRC